MKLLTTIAAGLISFSAFSQDLIEYNEGKFSRNGEELSMEQVEHLIEQYQAGWQAQVNFRRGMRFNRRSTDEGRFSMNLTGRVIYSVGTSAAGVCYGIGFLWANPIFGGLGDQEIANNYYLGGTAIAVVTAFSVAKISSPKYQQNRRETSFNIVANELNKAIKASNE